MHWRLPSQLIIASDPLVRDVVSSTMLRRHFDYDYLHRTVSSTLNRQLVTSLGVQMLTTQHLLEIGKAIVAQLQSNDGNASLSSTLCLKKTGPLLPFAITPTVLVQ